MLNWVVQRSLFGETQWSFGDTAENAIKQFKDSWGYNENSFNTNVKLKRITIHELKKPIGPKKFKELSQPKKRCLNPAPSISEIGEFIEEPLENLL